MAKVVFAGDQTNWPVCVCVCQCSLVVVQNASDSHNLAQTLRLSCDVATWVSMLPASADRL